MNRHASLNLAYRLIWSSLKQMWIPVAETSRGRRKSGAVVLAAGLLSLAGGGAWALPTGGQVSAGTGQIATSGAQLSVTQTSQNLSINWQDFSIGTNESVIFNQPGASAIALNRVTGQNASEILGSLQSNGQVFLLNPNGVLFGASAQVSVGGLVATTLGLGDSDFLAGNYRFSGASTASVSNAGTLQAATGGYVALLGASIVNAGKITAPMGNVSLAAGQLVTLTLDNGSLVGLTVDQGAVNALASNHGLIQANGGQVLLTAEAADQLTKAVVNNDGVIEAQTVANQGGTIRLLADMSNGEVTVAGTLDASAPQGGNGGQIETSGARMQAADGTVVTTLAANGANGTWVIDPEDFTVAPTGGDISGTTLGNSLASGNVTILSSGGTLNPGGTGSINVNDAVSWNANTLTLTAADNININAVMTAGGTAGLALNPATANGAQSAVPGGTINVALNGAGFTGRVDFVGGGNTLTINGTPYVILTALGSAGDSSGTTLQGMQGNLSGHYVLGANINAGATSTWNSGAGFAPVGSTGTPFTGVLDGLGHTISGLTINRNSDDEGLFGVMQSGSIVRNLGLSGVSVQGAGSYYGALAGLSSATMSNVFSTGVVNTSGLLSSNVGGLIGSNQGTISNSWSSAAVTAESSVAGGLAGWNNGGTISGSFASGAVVLVTGVEAGGLVGLNNGTIANTYAVGAVSGPGAYVGGLVGLQTLGQISNSYATGAVSTLSVNVGGLLGGLSGGTVTGSFWDTVTSGLLSSFGGLGLTDTQMKQASSFVGWSLATVGGSGSTWRIYDGNTMPVLTGLLTPITVTPTLTTVYNAATQGNTGTLNYSVTPDLSQILDVPAFAGTGRNAGTYALNVSGLYSSQLGYDISYAAGTLTINKATLTLSAATNTKTYDGGTTAAAAVGVSGLLGTDSISGLTEGYLSKNVLGANGSTLAVNGGYTLTDGNGGLNYTVVTNTALGTITPATLTLSASTNTKVYDGGTSAAGTVGVSGLVGTDTISGLTESYLSKNVLGANGSTLAVNGGYLLTDGNGGLNYTVLTNTAAGTITPATLTLSASTNTKVYDGGTSAVGTVGVSGLVGTDSISGLTESYLSKNVLGTNGSTLAVNGGYTLTDGNAGLNYTVLTNTAAGTITPATLNLSASTNTKVYDGGTSAAGAVGVSGLLGTDSISGLTESYLSKNVLGSNGSTLAVNGGYTLTDGNGGVNYTVLTHTAAGTITPATLTLSASTNTKVYDGGTTAAGAVGVSGLLGTDTLSGLTESYLSKNVLGANGSTLAVNGGYTLTDGNGGLNYTVLTNTALGTITPATLTLNATSNTKVFDGTTSATGAVGVTGLAGTDTLSGLTESYLSKNVLGTNGSTLVVNGGYTLTDGNGGLNYSILTNTALGTITPAPLTLSASGNTKVYDGTTSAAGTVSVSGLFGTDTVSGLTESYASKNVLGTNGSTLNVNGGYTVNDGNGGLNYAVALNTAVGTITPAALTLSASTNTKVYDGTTSATGTVGVSGLLGTDTLTGLTESYASKNVLGTNGSTLNVNGGFTLNDGNGGLNYSIVLNAAVGTITPATLTLSATGNTKVYDGSTSAAAAVGVTGLQSGDTITGLAESYASKNVLGTNGSTLNVNAGYTVHDGN